MVPPEALREFPRRRERTSRTIAAKHIRRCWSRVVFSSCLKSIHTCRIQVHIIYGFTHTTCATCACSVHLHTGIQYTHTWVTGLLRRACAHVSCKRTQHRIDADASALASTFVEARGHTGVCEKTLRCPSLGQAIRRQKLHSSPCVGALKAHHSEGFLLRRSVSFAVTGRTRSV